MYEVIDRKLGLTVYKTKTKTDARIYGEEYARRKVGITPSNFFKDGHNCRIAIKGADYHVVLVVNWEPHDISRKFFDWS